MKQNVAFIQLFCLLANHSVSAAREFTEQKFQGEFERINILIYRVEF